MVKVPDGWTSSQDYARIVEQQRDQYRLLFAALVAECVGVSDRSMVPGTVRIPVEAIEATRGLVLVEWPMVEFSYDFSVFRKGEEPK